jgi:hypothetical protein
MCSRAILCIRGSTKEEGKLGRVARFFLVQYTKMGKIYQNIPKTVKKTEWPYNLPTPLQDTPKFTQIGIFGLKTCHLATL